MRLIDKDALTADIQTTIEESGCVNHEGEILDCIAYADEIDAVPVVRGEWIAEQKGAEYCEFRCSICDGSIGQTDQFDETEVKQFSEWYKYCPMCGADMEDKP